MPSHSAKPSKVGTDDFPSFRGSISPLLGSALAFRSSPSSSSPERRRPRLRLLLALLVTSTLTAQSTPPAALQSTAVMMLLPAVHFGLLGLVALCFLAFRARLGGAYQSFTLDQGTDRTDALKTGALSALSCSLRLFQARLLDIRLWSTLSCFLYPALVLVSWAIPVFGQYTRATSDASKVAIAVTFLLGFSLLSAQPAPARGVFLTLSHLAVEALRWPMIRQGLESERRGAFLTISTAYSLAASLLFFAVHPFLLTSDEQDNAEIDLAASANYVVLTTVHQVVLAAAIHQVGSILALSTHLFSRALLLLGASTLGRSGRMIGGEWQQISLLLLGGSICSAALDPELSSSFKHRSRRLRRLFGLGRSSGDVWDLQKLDVGSPEQASHGPLSLSRRPRNGEPAVPNGSGFASNSPSQLGLALLSFAPLLVFVVRSSGLGNPANALCHALPAAIVRTTLCPVTASRHTVDLVFAYYDEDLTSFREHRNAILARPFVRNSDSHTIVYNKGGRSESELRTELELAASDEVIALENLGREGATYLQHIIMHYNDTAMATARSVIPHASPHKPTRVLADHTFFQQPHLAWPAVASPRMDNVDYDTGFAGLGPLVRTDCGSDGHGTGTYDKVREIYSVFTGALCPAGGQLSAWSGQFVVSRRRIMANPFDKYRMLLDLLEAPEGHWIHDTWGANDSGGPSNPALGHHVERAWPMVFNCTDVRIAESCPNDVHDKTRCQCLDDL